jgi:hypothetical protein
VRDATVRLVFTLSSTKSWPIEARFDCQLHFRQIGSKPEVVKARQVIFEFLEPILVVIANLKFGESHFYASAPKGEGAMTVSASDGPQSNDPGRPKAKDTWDKVDVIGKLLGAIAIPVGIAVLGAFANFVLQDRASREKTNEIAIAILQSKDQNIPELNRAVATALACS